MTAGSANPQVTGGDEFSAAFHNTAQYANNRVTDGSKPDCVRCEGSNATIQHA